MQDFAAFLSIRRGEKNGKMPVDEWNFLKTHFFFLSTLALMPLSILVDHSVQTAETRNARCHLLGCKLADANHNAWPLEEFLSADFPRYPGRVGKKPMVQHLVLTYT